MNVSETLAQAATVLQSASPSPRLDAEVLLAHVLGLTRTALYARTRDALDAGQTQKFSALIARRGQGEPVAYLTGVKEFWSLPLHVTPDVLIPRPETELLVEWGLEILNTSFPRRRESRIRAAELGTGSGAIALALARELPDTVVVAIEVSAAALEVARMNADALRITNVRFAESDFSAFLDSRFRGNDDLFDLIVSNPPYVAEGDPHLRDLTYEPAGALVAGKDGLDCLRPIIAKAPENLRPGGWLLVEHGADQGVAVRELFNAAGFVNVDTRRDLAGLERATGGQHRPNGTMRETL